MAKKAQFFTEAERLYIDGHQTLESIAAKLKISERTVWAWKEEGDWETKRAKFLEAASSTHEKTFTLYNLILKRVTEQLENNQEPSQSQLYTLTKLAPLFAKIQTYEESQVRKGAPEATALSESAIKEIERAVLGITRNA